MSALRADIEFVEGMLRELNSQRRRLYRELADVRQALGELRERRVRLMEDAERERS